MIVMLLVNHSLMELLTAKTLTRTCEIVVMEPRQSHFLWVSSAPIGRKGQHATLQRVQRCAKVQEISTEFFAQFLVDCVSLNKFTGKTSEQTKTIITI